MTLQTGSYASSKGKRADRFSTSCEAWSSAAGGGVNSCACWRAAVSLGIRADLLPMVPLDAKLLADER